MAVLLVNGRVTLTRGLEPPTLRGMDTLHAPWRIQYILAPKAPPSDDWELPRQQRNVRIPQFRLRAMPKPDAVAAAALEPDLELVRRRHGART